jgi:hypothetical protein
LVDQISAGSGWTLWKAMDETLARSVTVLTFAPGFPRIPQVVTAARAASRLNDPRLAQVFDVEDSGDSAYAVMEWLAGQTLTDLLADGPLEPGRAVSLCAEAAQALAVAHAAGQSHLRLTPDSLRWTRSGGVKISGLGIEAALAGTAVTGAGAGDPALTDTQGLARLLYAALTGYWPGDEPGPLPPAPVSDGRLCTPRQVSADVSPAIDEVVCRALFQRGTRHGPAIASPSVLADSLVDVTPPVPLPDPAPAMPSGPSGGYGHREDTSAWALAPAGTGRGGTAPYRARSYPAAERSPGTRAIVSLVIVLVLVAIGATAWVLSTSLHHGSSPQARGSTPTHSSTSAAAAVVLTSAGITTFDPYGDGNEDSGEVRQALAGDSGNPWHTSYYLTYSKFGHLKPGTGLILDMGKQVSLSSVSIQFGTSCCTSFKVMIGNDNTESKSNLSAFTTVASSTKGVGPTTVPVNSTATGRYVLIWLTNLAPLQGQDGRFQAFVSQITVHGTTARSSG